MSGYINFSNCYNFSKSNNYKSGENESEIFEDNFHFVKGFNFLFKVMEIHNEFQNFGEDIIEDLNSFDSIISTDDIFQDSIEEEIDKIIKIETNKLSKKKIFKLYKDTGKDRKTENSNNVDNNVLTNGVNSNFDLNLYESNLKKDNNNHYHSTNNKIDSSNNENYNNHNHLRNEAYLVDIAVSNLNLPNYKSILDKKFKNCTLLSHKFYKNFYNKKEIGKEKNYIFNFNDSYLLDMNDIDKCFFEKHLTKFNPFSELIFNGNFQKNNVNKFYEGIADKILPFKIQNNFVVNKNDNLELIFSFIVYHPWKNTKTQQIEVLGSGTLRDLRDKIYCVLDELDNEKMDNINEEISDNNQSQSMKEKERNKIKNASFFFIENTFYNDIRNGNNTLSSKIICNKNIHKKSLGNKSIFIKSSNKEYIENSIYSKGESSCNMLKNWHDKNQDKELFKTNSKFDIYNSNFYCEYNEIKDLIENSNFIETDMGAEKLDNIIFRVGYPYLFRHKEYCDHLILLAEIRVMDIYDFNTFRISDLNDDKSVVTFQKKLKRRLCDFCKYFYSK